MYLFLSSVNNFASLIALLRLPNTLVFSGAKIHPYLHTKQVYLT